MTTTGNYGLKERTELSTKRTLTICSTIVGFVTKKGGDVLGFLHKKVDLVTIN